MSDFVSIVGTGFVTTLGNSAEEHIRGLATGRGIYRTRKLYILDEYADIPYLSADLSRYPDCEKDAQSRLETLLDRALLEALGEFDLSLEARRDIPVFIGSSSNGIGIGEQRYQSAIVNTSDPVPVPLDGYTQINNHLRRHHGFYGPDFAFNTACTSSANALLSAATAITCGRSDYALVVGLEIFNITTLAGFFGMQLLAPEVMRPFDKNRSGLVLGEGCAALLLKSTEANDKGLRICSGASRCDTYGISASNPDGSAVAKVMQDALDVSEVSATEIIAIKAHGTASPLNDDGEAAGMKKVFRTIPPFFSLKSYIGHTLGGCGAIETALVATCLNEGWLPASAGFECVDESLGVVPLRTACNAGPGYYMLNFFGFGGNNCSLVVHKSL